MKTLCIGQEWRGSNASGLFYALSRNGLTTNIINEHRYISLSAHHKFLKVVHRILRPWQVQDYNNTIEKQFRAFSPELVLVYKGAFITKKTLQKFKAKKVPVVVFYPDISFLAHGPFIPKCIPLYDYIFTTKSFASTDLAYHFGYPKEKVSFIPHGFDPMLHRPLAVKEDNLRCDVSFIGNYSPHKALILEGLIRRLPTIDLKIWGGTWQHYQGEILGPYIQGQGLIGDAYVAAINASAINLAILSEQVQGASSGDLITSRTFHITGSGGFMLHQRTEESLLYFREDYEAIFFEDPDELADKVKYFLTHEEKRKVIAANGRKRALMEHSLDVRAQNVIEILKTTGIIK